jgi:hypothetical protein
MSSSKGKPSNHSSVAAILSDRGFVWSPSNIDEVLSNSSSISFENEWKKFIQVVQRITGIISTTAGNSAVASEETEPDALQALFAAVASGKALLNELQGPAADEGSESAISAWNCFQQVIDPSSIDDTAFTPIVNHSPVGDLALVGVPSSDAPDNDLANVGDHDGDNDPANVGDQSPEVSPGNIGHTFERFFDTALFRALRESLDGYVDETVDANWIVLKNSTIGFGRKVQRSTFGFKDDYAFSGKNESDHGCFVLGTDTIKKHENLRARKEGVNVKRPRASKRRREPFWYTDMTASVELKLDNTSCERFIVIGNVVKGPILGSTHGPLGQAMMYTMDSWHCLARRGVSVESVPVVVLAGRREKSENESKKKMMCCCEAHIQIPQHFGMTFTYSIDRVVTFNGTTGLFKDEQSIDEETRDKRAIAIYIKTMRFGLEKAYAVVMNSREVVNSVPPVSLCCRNLLTVETNAHLIAGPIPREKHQWKPGLKISQGEFFQITKPTKGMFSGLVGLRWFVSDEFDHNPLTEDYLVKVSCAAVHNIYVPPVFCNEALKDLYYEGNANLKTSIGKVLLGYCHTSTSKSLISIMKDLRKGDKVFKMLEHKEMCAKNKVSKLWDGFCDLVNSLLLPMADLNVVHLDIRSDNELTYNILVHEDETKMELYLIDFDSVVLSTAANFDDREGNSAAIWFNQLGNNGKEATAYQYLFWQVLWIAYRWHPLPESTNITTAQDFVSFLLKDDKFVEFKVWLGSKNTEYLTSLKYFAKISRKDIQNALKFLKNLF